MISSFFSSLRLATLVACVVLTAGCATPALKKGELPKAISLVEEPSPIEASAEVRAFFVKSLEEQLFETGRLFVKGQGLTIRWKVLENERGSRALRYMVGFGAGQARFKVLMTLLDEKNRLLATGEFKGRKTMGWFGGGAGGAVREAADHVAFFVEDKVYAR